MNKKGSVEDKISQENTIFYESEFFGPNDVVNSLK